MHPWPHPFSSQQIPRICRLHSQFQLKILSHLYSLKAAMVILTHSLHSPSLRAPPTPSPAGICFVTLYPVFHPLWNSKWHIVGAQEHFHPSTDPDILRYSILAASGAFRSYCPLRGYKMNLTASLTTNWTFISQSFLTITRGSKVYNAQAESEFHTASIDKTEQNKSPYMTSRVVSSKNGFHCSVQILSAHGTLIPSETPPLLKSSNRLVQEVLF